MSDLPALSQLMGAYFHQDWDNDGDEWDVVDLFIQHERAAAANLPDEIAWTLDTYRDEPSLKRFLLDDLGGCYLADADGGTYRQWLTQVADRIRALTSASGS